MRAKLKELYSFDFDLRHYWPDDPEVFGFALRAIIGPEDEPGGDSFDFQVCTPDWLKAKYSKEEAVFGRHYVIVFDYDMAKIEQKIARYCESCIGESWQELAEKLSRIGRWEFEDYVPYTPQ